MLTRSAGLALFAALTMTLSASGHDHVKSTKAVIVPEPDVLPGHEKDTYRYGQIMGAVRGSSPAACELVCSQNNLCATWTYLPATFESGPICELKATIGQQISRPGAFSGIALRLQPGSPRPPQMRVTRPAVPKPTPKVMQTVKTPPPPNSGLMGGPVAMVNKPNSPAPVPVAKKPSVPAPAPKPMPVPPPPAPPAPENSANLAPTPLPQTVLAPKSPPGPEATRKVPQFQMVAAPPTPTPAPEPLQPQAQPAQPAQPVPVIVPNRAPAARKPWTEREGDDAGYSVGGLDYVPGDEQATAGYGSQFNESH